MIETEHEGVGVAATALNPADATGAKPVVWRHCTSRSSRCMREPLVELTVLFVDVELIQVLSVCM
jgi:hypothetical protein